jgi:hypothetical protein
MCGIIYLQAINRNVVAQLIEQGSIKIHKAIVPSRMGEETHGPTPVRRIDHGGDISGDKGAAGLPDNLPCRLLDSAREVLLHQRDQGMRLLRDWRVQEALQFIRLLRIEIACPAQVCIGLAGILLLATRQIAGIVATLPV